jgi:hypothetical protein
MSQVPARPPTMPGPLGRFRRTPPVKVASLDTILTGEEPKDIESMTNLVFQQIGGHEIISMLRSQNIVGQNVSYQPFINMADIVDEYSSRRIIPLPGASDRFFRAFPIDISLRFPDKPFGFSLDKSSNIYVEDGIDESGEQVPDLLVIEVANLKEGETVEVQILTTSDVFLDTIEEE